MIYRRDWTGLLIAIVIVCLLYVLAISLAHGRELEATIERYPDMYWDSDGQLHVPGLTNPYPEQIIIDIQPKDSWQFNDTQRWIWEEWQRREHHRLH